MHTVYLVDDDKPILDAYWMKRGLFKECGFEICGAETTPIEALKEIKTLRPEVVISDLKMPGMTGVELLTALQEELFPPLFVIVSAYNEYKDVRRLFRTTNGFDYLVKPMSDEILLELLTRMAAKLDCGAPQPENNTGSRKLDEILQYIDEYFTMNHTLESIGERYSLAPNYVCNLFNKYLGTSFTAYLIALRMEKAEHLLKTTNARVKEIAVKCGYDNQFYFSRLFQKKHRMSPIEYRKAHYEK